MTQPRDFYNKQGMLGYTGTTWREIRTDSVTRALNCITYPHHEIHAGCAYVIRSFAEIPINNFFDIQITTPNTTKWLHMTFEFECESETNFWVYQNVAINTAGTAIVAGNRNLNSTNTSGATFAGIANTSEANANADTAVAGAVLLASGVIGTGNRAGGSSHSEEEVILKQNEDYTVRFEAVAAGYVNYKLDWYEHIDRSP